MIRNKYILIVKLRCRLGNSLISIYILTSCDDRRPEDDQSRPETFAYVISVAKNRYNKTCVYLIDFICKSI